MKTYMARVFNARILFQTFFSYLFCHCARTLRRLRGIALDYPTDQAGIRMLLEKKFGRPPPPIDAMEKSSENSPGGGVVGMIYRIHIKYCRCEDEEEERRAKSKSSSTNDFPRSLLVKKQNDNFQSRRYSTFFGTAREAMFYTKIAPQHPVFASCLPDVYYSRGSLLTGEFMIVMEDLTGEAAVVSHMLGNQCWGPLPSPLPEAVKGIGDVEIVRTIFQKMAEVHARFWMDESLLKEEWMRGVKWRKGGGRWSWETAFHNTRVWWSILSASDSGQRIFTSLQREAIERLLKGTDWDVWQRENGVKAGAPETSTYFTLTHGDFHAGNVLWRIDKSRDQAVIVDWSEVGIGCPFTELAQFMISNTSADFRRENEQQLFHQYYQCLVEQGVDSTKFPLEVCWERYKAGGIERWLQLFMLLASVGFPEFSLLWFSRQVDLFLKDHYSSIPKCFNSVYGLPLK